MEATPRLPMLSFDVKRSPVLFLKFGPHLEEYIKRHYGEDPKLYSKAFAELDQLREDIADVGYDYVVCTTLKRYYAQLQFLQGRFPMKEGEEAATVFTWEDVQTGKFIEGDIKFEQACILYNIGSVHSQLGVLDTRQNAEGMKISCTHFQCAAWAFEYLRDNFGSSSMSTDLSFELLSFHILLMLAQAQECILEKSMLDGRKNNITAKVAAQVVDFYRQSIAAIDVCDSKNQINSRMHKEWRKRMNVKMSFYQCITYYYQGKQAEEAEKHGECLAYFTGAKDKLAEVAKLAKNEVSEISECLKYCQDVVMGKYNSAKKDNDFVYHDKVPPLESLPEVKGASLVKGIPFNPNDKEISGPDIFQKLVPMEAHEASSVYSEEKAKLLRKVKGDIEQKDMDLDQFMSSLQLDMEQLMPKPDTMPERLMEKCAAMSVRTDAIQELTDSMAAVSGLATEVDLGINEIQELIDNDTTRTEQFEEQYGRKKPSNVLQNLLSELGGYRERNSEGSQLNSALHRAMNKHTNNLKTLTLQPSQILTQLPPSQPSLSPEEEAVVSEVRRLLMKVTEMKEQRMEFLGKLTDQLHNDDITNALVTQDAADKQELYADQLKKHDTLVQHINLNLSAQDKILRSLTDANARFALIRQAFSRSAAEREKAVQELILSYEKYEDLLAKCAKGSDYNKKLLDNVNKTLERCRSECKIRQEERDMLIIRFAPKVAAPSRPSAPKPGSGGVPGGVGGEAAIGGAAGGGYPTPSPHPMAPQTQPVDVTDPSGVQTLNPDVLSTYPSSATLMTNPETANLPAAFEGPKLKDYLPFMKPRSFGPKSSGGGGGGGGGGASTSTSTPSLNPTTQQPPPPSPSPSLPQHPDSPLPQNPNDIDANLANVLPASIAQYIASSIAPSMSFPKSTTNHLPSSSLPSPSTVPSHHRQQQYPPASSNTTFNDPRYSNTPPPPQPPGSYQAPTPQQPLPTGGSPHRTMHGGSPLRQQQQQQQQQQHHQYPSANAPIISNSNAALPNQPGGGSHPRMPLAAPHPGSTPSPNPMMPHSNMAAGNIQPPAKTHTSIAAAPPSNVASGVNPNPLPNTAVMNNSSAASQFSSSANQPISVGGGGGYYQPQQHQQQHSQQHPQQQNPQMGGGVIGTAAGGVTGVMSRPDITNTVSASGTPVLSSGKNVMPATTPSLSQQQQQQQQQHHQPQQPANVPPQQVQQGALTNQYQQILPKQQVPQQVPQQPPHQQQLPMNQQQQQHIQPQIPSNQQQLQQQQHLPPQQPQQYNYNQYPHPHQQHQQPPPPPAQQQAIQRPPQTPSPLPQPTTQTPPPTQLNYQQQQQQQIHPQQQHQQYMNQQQHQQPLPPNNPNNQQQVATSNYTQQQQQQQKHLYQQQAHTNASTSYEYTTQNNSQYLQGQQQQNIPPTSHSHTAYPQQQQQFLPQTSQSQATPQQNQPYPNPSQQSASNVSNNTATAYQQQPGQQHPQQFTNPSNAAAHPVSSQQTVSNNTAATAYQQQPGHHQHHQQQFTKPSNAHTAHPAVSSYHPTTHNTPNTIITQQPQIPQPHQPQSMAAATSTLQQHQSPHSSPIKINYNTTGSGSVVVPGNVVPGSSSTSNISTPYSNRQINPSAMTTTTTTTTTTNQYNQQQQQHNQAFYQQTQQQFPGQSQQQQPQQHLYKQQQQPYQTPVNNINNMNQPNIPQHQQQQQRPRQPQANPTHPTPAIHASSNTNNTIYQQQHQQGYTTTYNPNNPQQQQQGGSMGNSNQQLRPQILVPPQPQQLQQQQQPLHPQPYNHQQQQPQNQPQQPGFYNTPQAQRPTPTQQQPAIGAYGSPPTTGVMAQPLQPQQPLQPIQKPLQPSLSQPLRPQTSGLPAVTGQQPVQRQISGPPTPPAPPSPQVPIVPPPTGPTTTTTGATLPMAIERQNSSLDDILSSSPNCAADSLPIRPKVLTDQERQLEKEQAMKNHHQSELVAREPYGTQTALHKLLSDVETFGQMVDGLSTCILGVSRLDAIWKSLLDSQESNNKKQSIAIARCYPMKNRDPDIMPYDETRVILSSTKDDYINASWLNDLAPSCPKFITTQSPLPQTCVDFWTMVYEQGTEVLVQITSEYETGKFPVYYPTEREKPMEQGPIILSLQSVKFRQNWVERIVYLKNNLTKQGRTVVHLQFKSWPVSGFPEDVTTIVHFISEVHTFYKQQRTLTKPIIVHCGTGVGRSGVLVLVYAAIQELVHGNGLVDIPGLTKRLMHKRKVMLVNKEQLLCAYQCLLCFGEEYLSKRGILVKTPHFSPTSTQSSSSTSSSSSSSLLSSSHTKDGSSPAMMSSKKTHSRESSLSNHPSSHGHVVDDIVFGTVDIETIRANVGLLHVKEKENNKDNNKDNNGKEDKQQQQQQLSSSLSSSSTVVDNNASNVGGGVGTKAVGNVSDIMSSLPDVVQQHRGYVGGQVGQGPQSASIPPSTNQTSALQQPSSLSETASMMTATSEKGAHEATKSEGESNTTTGMSNLAQLQDPTTFTLGSPEKQRPRITKANFNQEEGRLLSSSGAGGGGGGGEETAEDPLASLNPLWSLGK